MYSDPRGVQSGGSSAAKFSGATQGAVPVDGRGARQPPELFGGPLREGKHAFTAELAGLLVDDCFRLSEFTTLRIELRLLWKYKSFSF
jgi:hypothetical protein